MMMNLLLAAEEGAHAEVLDVANWLPGATMLVVFILAFLILYWKVWGPITRGLDERDAKIRREIAAAEAARRESEEKQSEFEKQLAKAREEADRDRAQMRANVERYRDELRADAEKEVARMKQRAIREIEAAKAAAVTELHAESASLATSIASKILQREITSADQQSLVSQSLEEMAARS